MNVGDVRMIVRAMEARPTAAPSLMPASVTEVDTTNNILRVVLDGQPVGQDIDVRPLINDVGPGDRVMVMYDPPRGGYVIGVIGRRHSAGETVAYLTRETTLVGVINAQQTLLSGSVEFVANRLYRLEYSVAVTRTASSPRAQARLWSDTTQLQSANVSLTGSVIGGLITRSVLFQPGDLTPVISVTVEEIDNSGSFNCPASATSPTYVLVTDAGPAFSS